MRDELADVAPEDFVAARDALAKELKAAGDAEGAAEVKKLRKPTVQQWIADQVVRHDTGAVGALRAASAEVAAAQEALISGGDRQALKDATTAQRAALRDVATAVAQALARNGRPAAHRDEIAASIAADVIDEVSRGATFGLRDDIELPERKAPARDVEAERKAAERAAELEAAEARVERARAELEKAESALAAVVERHRRVQGDA
jgi:hypothetical protein